MGRTGSPEPVRVRELIAKLDEIDRQYVTKGDNWWAGAALTVRMLAEHADGSMRDWELMRDWEPLIEEGYEPTSEAKKAET